jgi:hypothetical protein
MLKKMGLGACDAGPVKATLEDARSSALASESQSKKQSSGVRLPPMQAAFLSGLLDLAQRETGDELISLPTGDVDPQELRTVIVALLRARGREAGQ